MALPAGPYVGGPAVVACTGGAAEVAAAPLCGSFGSQQIATACSARVAALLWPAAAHSPLRSDATGDAGTWPYAHIRGEGIREAAHAVQELGAFRQAAFL
eukprot:361432-Chlamydomonas_euryale.AAC.4